jgi:hypothetical protein
LRLYCCARTGLPTSDWWVTRLKQVVLMRDGAARTKDRKRAPLLVAGLSARRDAADGDDPVMVGDVRTLPDAGCLGLGAR